MKWEGRQLNISFILPQPLILRRPVGNPVIFQAFLPPVTVLKPQPRPGQARTCELWFHWSVLLTPVPVLIQASGPRAPVWPMRALGNLLPTCPPSSQQPERLPSFLFPLLTGRKNFWKCSWASDNKGRWPPRPSGPALPGDPWPLRD